MNQSFQPIGNVERERERERERDHQSQLIVLNVQWATLVILPFIGVAISIYQKQIFEIWESSIMVFLFMRS